MPATQIARRLDAVLLTQTSNGPEGRTYEASCPDWFSYQTLPDVVALADRERLVRTGWNSDRARAYYRPESELPCFVGSRI